MPIATASQTIGPYWHLIEHREFADLTRFGAAGERMTLTGRVTDGDGAPLADGCIELWQASPTASETFPGYGRAAADHDGRFRFTTIRPGPLPGPGNAQQAPHFALSVMARGILDPADHARVFRRRGAERDRPDPVADRGPGAARDTAGAAGGGGGLAHRHPPAGRGRNRVHGFLSRMPVNPADSAIYGTLYGSDAMRAVFDDHAGLRRMLDVEAALATVQARLRLIPADAAAAIAAAAQRVTTRRRGAGGERAQCRLSGRRAGGGAGARGGRGRAVDALGRHHAGHHGYRAGAATARGARSAARRDRGGGARAGGAGGAPSRARRCRDGRICSTRCRSRSG